MPSKPGTAEDRRIAVALTFDFDAESAWLNPARGEPPVALSRWVYGVYEGIPRILKLLAKYDLPATFFIPGATCDNHSDVVRAIAGAGHEIGHHGYYHEAPHVLSVDEERTMIETGLDALQRIVGVTPRGYRSPSWELSKATFGLLDEYGFAYDASQLARDRPYWIEDQGQRRDLVEVPSAWSLCD
jgi:peptidoglycan/xylan/chitin deacetylase (PgdA/CDA1 family)